MWESCFEDGSGLITLPEIITDKKRLLLDFLPFKRRKLNRRGISISGIVYYSPILKKFQQKQEFIIKYDPTSMKRVWARPINESTYFELTYADLRLPDVSLSEFKAAKKCTRDSSRGRTPVAEVFAAIERNERRELDAKKATKRERVDREKRLINSEEPLRKDILGSSEPLPKSQLSVNYDTPAQIFESDDE
jgi:putative transposase